jgi:hypothetical protein
MGRWRVLWFLLGLGGLIVALPWVSDDRHPQKGPAPLGNAGIPPREDRASDLRSKSAVRVPKPLAESNARLLSALRSTDPVEHTLALETLIPELIRRDNHGAMDLLVELKSWERREQALLVASREFGYDPPVAITWLLRLGNQDEKAICRAAACRRMLETIPEAALSLAGPDDTLLEELTAAYVARSPEDGLRWIAEKAAPEKRDRLLASGIQALAARSPEEAASLAASGIEDPVLLEEAVISALHQWVLTDRQAAAAWVELFPEGPLRERAEGELFGTN